MPFYMNNDVRMFEGLSLIYSRHMPRRADADQMDRGLH